MSLMTWFETLLVVATLGSGAVWLLDALFFAKRRKAKGGLLDEEPVLVDEVAAALEANEAAAPRVLARVRALADAVRGARTPETV